jgi:predicted RNA-binding Zn-ribbon protein involved in translation (DUF1610 family)
MFVLVEHHTKLLGGARRPPKPGDQWDEMSGNAHACNPHGRSHTFCGRLIVGSREGWFVGDDCGEAGLVTCATCHSILRKRGEE